jgi:hypothetical protein
MGKLIVIESQELPEAQKCTTRQFDYIRGLMSKTKHEEVWLNTLAFNGRDKLTVKSASKLIDALLKQQDFELRELRG